MELRPYWEHDHALALYVFGVLAQVPGNKDIYMRVSGGRRKAGRPQRYYVFGAGDTFAVLADSIEAAVVKANQRIARLTTVSSGRAALPAANESASRPAAET